MWMQFSCYPNMAMTILILILFKKLEIRSFRLHSTFDEQKQIGWIKSGFYMTGTGIVLNGSQLAKMKKSIPDMSLP